MRDSNLVDIGCGSHDESNYEEKGFLGDSDLNVTW